MDIFYRHEGHHDEPQEHHHHHSSNAKYSNIVLGTTALALGAIALANYVRSSSVNSKFSRILNVSLALQVTCWALFTITLSIVPVAWAKEITADLLLDFARRIGRVGYALVPFNVFLAVRPNPLPRTFYLSLIPLHKWISRLMILLTTVHGLGFLFKWGYEDKLIKVLKFANFTGISCTAMLVLVSVISLRPLRKISYGLFYSGHTITAWSMLLLVTFHARPSAHIYTLLTFLLMAYSVGCKLYYTNTYHFTVESNDYSSLSLVHFPNDHHKSYSPGSHVRVSEPLTSYRSWLYATHPYTVASLESDDTVTLVVRKTRFDLNNRMPFAVSQTFRAVPEDFFRSASNVVIAAGGSGIAFGLPLLRYLMAKKQQDDETVGSVKFVWCIKDKADMFVLKRLGIMSRGELTSAYRGVFEVFVTGKKLVTRSGSAVGGKIKESFVTRVAKLVGLSKSSGSKGAYEEVGQAEEEEQAEEMEMSTLQPKEEEEMKDFVHKGRPDLEEHFEVLEGVDNSWIVSCGPVGLVKDCNELAKKMKVKHVYEEYAL